MAQKPAFLDNVQKKDFFYGFPKPSKKIECHSNINVTQIGMALKFEYHSNWNIIQIRTQLKLKCHSNKIKILL